SSALRADRYFVALFCRLLERIERLAPELVEIPAQGVQPCRIELVNAIPPVATLAHHTRLLENAEVLRNGRTADVEMFGEFVDPVGTSEQVLEHGTPGRVGDRSERVNLIGNHLVTHYSRRAASCQAHRSSRQVAHRDHICIMAHMFVTTRTTSHGA